MSDLSAFLSNHPTLLKDFAGPVATIFAASVAAHIALRLGKGQVAIATSQAAIARDKLKFDLFAIAANARRGQSSHVIMIHVGGLYHRSLHDHYFFRAVFFEAFHHAYLVSNNLRGHNRFSRFGVLGEIGIDEGINRITDHFFSASIKLSVRSGYRRD